MAKRTLVILVATIVAFAVDAAPAAAISRAQAVKVALAALAPQKEKGRVVVFATPAAIPKGSSVIEAGPRKLRRGAFTLSAPLTTGKIWLVWADLAYGARFKHPSRIVLVDDARGAASKPLRLVWAEVEERLDVAGRARPFGLAVVRASAVVARRNEVRSRRTRQPGRRRLARLDRRYRARTGVVQSR